MAAAVLAYPFLGRLVAVCRQAKLKAEHESLLPPPSGRPLPPPPAGRQDEPEPAIIIEQWQPMRLIIPSIDLDYIVLSGSVFDEQQLDQGPVHYETSSLPGTLPGNVAIAGHRAGRWGFFLRLDELAEDDPIYLETGGYRFVYRVEWQAIVEPAAWSVVEPTDYPALTLTTCEPKNRPATHRLVVRASLERVDFLTLPYYPPTDPPSP